MNTRHLLRIASITSAAFLTDGKRDRVERRKAIAKPWRPERRASMSMPAHAKRIRFAA